MSFPAYSEMVDSGIEWLGLVPKQWSVKPLKNVAKVVNGFPFDSKLFDLDEGYPLVRIRDLNKSVCETYYRGDFVASASITADDVLIGMDGDFNVGRWYGPSPALLNQRMCCVRGYSSQISRFLEYALPIPLNAINDVTYSTTVKHLSSYEVEKCRFAVPPKADLDIILTFLDRETAKIDTLIDEQKRLIDLLKEKRQVVISHAVTKGLNPNVPMKDSGIEWLGMVPAHWEVRRLKRLSPLITVGIVVNPSNYVSDEGLPFVYGGDISEGSINLETCRRITIEHSKQNKKTQLHAGDLLTVRVGAPGVTSVVPKECEGGNCASVMLTRKGNFSSNWLCFAMNSRVLRYQVEVVQYGAAQECFNISHAVDFAVPTPPIEEQSEIATELEVVVSAINKLAAEADRSISLLQERRSALISAAVTGKIDVRELVGSERSSELAIPEAV
jgi:type I restriction enzyme S subunit